MKSPLTIFQKSIFLRTGSAVLIVFSSRAEFCSTKKNCDDVLKRHKEKGLKAVASNGAQTRTNVRQIEDVLSEAGPRALNVNVTGKTCVFLNELETHIGFPAHQVFDKRFGFLDFFLAVLRRGRQNDPQ